jgi:hypothetical protein
MRKIVSHCNKTSLVPSKLVFAFARLAATVCLILQPCFAADQMGVSAAGVQTIASHNNHNLRDLIRDEQYVKTAEINLEAHARGSKEEIEIAQGPIMGGLQAVAFMQSVTGDPIGAVDTFNRESVMWNHVHGSPVVGDVQADLRSIDSSHAVDAIDAIVQAAKHRQIVILNEAHHVEYDRVFARRLAEELRKIGYEYLACETFDGTNSNVLSQGYVTNDTGYYSREPMFVNFLTKAIADGWKFISYEPIGPDDAWRESNMAKNIVQQIFSKNPKARVFVYVGYSHAQKVPVAYKDDDRSKLAAQLKRLTGIDPLTINQTTLYDHYTSDQQESYYARARKKVRGMTPVVLLTKNGGGLKLSGDKSAFDFEVVYPRYEIDPNTGRPTWMGLLSIGGLQPREVPQNLLPDVGSRLIYAYRANSPKDASPFDVVMVKAGEPAPKLMLPAGDFEFEFED